ncbi:MAG TPA: hypothetical protein VHZ81_07335 [Galbitalea sp.]|nr:hypothetical protein [Galbitalea sp.]
MASPPQLRSTPIDPTLVTAFTGYERVGLDGVLTGAPYRLHRAIGRGSLLEFAYGWRFADQWSGVWWPQGIAVGDYNGAPLALVSAYAKQDRHGNQQGARISVIDLRDAAHPAYRHVLLVSPRRTESGVVLDPVLIHAGGIAWMGDRLLVAATFDGIREFRLSDIRRVPRGSEIFGYDFVLPEFSHHEPADSSLQGRMRYSFITVETGSAIRSDASSAKLVAGEYARDDSHRLARVTQSGDQTVVEQSFIPGIVHMQGAALHNGTWYVSSSHGENRGGDLWSGPIDALRKRDRVLPPGPEALAVWPERNQLWSVSEVPGRRWIYGIDLARLT